MDSLPTRLAIDYCSLCVYGRESEKFVSLGEIYKTSVCLAKVLLDLMHSP